jgi:hemerythrin-like domain-containing protein
MSAFASPVWLATGFAVKLNSLTNPRIPGDLDMPTAKKSPAKGGASTRTPDALALLTADHREVKGLFKEYEKLCKADADADEKEALAEQICEALKVHTTIEEELLYPAARELLSDDDLVDEAEVEHASAKDLIAQIEGMRAGQDLYDAKVKVLGEYIEHHVQEEEKELFPKLKKAGLDSKSLGPLMSARKEQLFEEGVEVSA